MPAYLNAQMHVVLSRKFDIESIVGNNATNDFDTCCSLYSTSKGQQKGT